MWIPSLGPPTAPRRPVPVLLLVMGCAVLALCGLFVSQARHARNARGCEANLVRIQRLLQERVRDQGRYPGRLEGLPVPACPSTGTSESYHQGYHSDGYSWRVACSGPNHVGAGLPPGSPRLESRPQR